MRIVNFNSPIKHFLRKGDIVYWMKDVMSKGDEISLGKIDKIIVKKDGETEAVENIEWDYLISNDKSVLVHLENDGWKHGYQLLKTQLEQN